MRFSRANRIGPRCFGSLLPKPRSARFLGFTLIELLIALVVLMIGVYGMLRVFPAGYAAVEASQQQTAAAQLADAELSRWKLDPDSLPDAVVATNYNGEIIPITLTNSIDDLVLGNSPYLSFSVTPVSPGATDYPVWQGFGLNDLAILAQAAPPLLYNPTDLTPSQFDSVQGYHDPVKAGQVSNEKRALVLHPNWQPNSLYLPRTVIGERIDLRSLPQTGAGVPFYLLTHAPCALLRREVQRTVIVGKPVTTTTQDVYFDIYDARPWVFRPGLSALQLNKDGGQYSLNNNQLVVYPSLSSGIRSFRVDYTDLNTRTRVIGATVNVARGQTGGPIPGPGGSSQANPDPSTIQVFERLVQLTEAEHNQYLQSRNLDDWPRNAYYVNNLSTISGQILFSPALQVNPLPTDVAIAKVDYRVFDWQVLVFDVEVPPDGIVRLPVQNIKSGSYINPPRQPRPQPVATAVREFYGPDGNPEYHPDLPAWAKDKRSWAYVIAVDRQSGDILTENEGIEWPTNPWMRRSRFKANYNAGMLQFNYDDKVSMTEINRSGTFRADVDTPNRTGRTYRILCRAQNDWAVQLLVASRVYARSSNPLSPSGSPVGMTANSTTMLAYAWSPAQENPAQIYFPLSENGQTVAVDYYYSNPNGKQTFVSGEVHTIGWPVANKISTGVGFEVREWVCRLTEPLAHRPNAWGPTTVRGLSVRARSTWVTTGRSTTFQDIVAAGVGKGVTSAVRTAPARLNETWHQAIISAYLTRAPI